MNEPLQGTEQWRLDRLGKVTGSRMADVIGRRRDGKRTAEGIKYQLALLEERITGNPVIQYKSKAMMHGTEIEETARVNFEMETGLETTVTGFINHSTIPMFGSSPDALIGHDGGLEIKGPETRTHLATILGEPIDDGYILQIQTNMAVTGRKWWYYCSFDDRVPPNMQIFIQRIPRDEKRIAEIITETEVFNRELAAMEAKLRKYQP